MFLNQQAQPNPGDVQMRLGLLHVANSVRHLIEKVG